MGVLVASTELPLSRSCVWRPPQKKTQPPSTGLQEGDTGSGEEGGEDAGAGDPSPPRSLGQGEAGGSGQGQGGQHRGGQGGPGRQRGAAGAAAAEAVQGVGVAVADVHRQPARGSRARGQPADPQNPPGHPLDPPPPSPNHPGSPADAPARPPAVVVALGEVVQVGGVDGPEVALAVVAAAGFDEALVEGQVVPHAVAPALLLAREVPSATTTTTNNNNRPPRAPHAAPRCPSRPSVGTRVNGA